MNLSESLKNTPMPPLREGDIRLYRAEPIPKEIEATRSLSDDHLPDAVKNSFGRWFTDDPEALDWYATHEYFDGRAVFIDIPQIDAEKYRVSNIPLKPGGRDAFDNPRAWSLRPEEEFFLPKELLGGVRELARAVGPHFGRQASPPERPKREVSLQPGPTWGGR